MMTVFDGGSPPRRLALLGSYKAQRPPMPVPLREQFPLVEEYLRRTRMPWVRMPLEEADDVIATIARKAVEDGSDVLIVTNDKDMYQLVDEHTRMVAPSDTDRIMSAEDVRGKTGVGPGRIVEWLALIGDASDNIGGVPGVGPKTAAKLLTQHGSINGIFEELAAVTSASVRKALEQNREIVLRNVELIRLARDLDCSPDWVAAEVKPEDPERLLPFLKDLELNSLTRELEEASEKVLF
jgi:DNA polymerase-1